MTEPKKVSDFAKEYQETYIGFTQCKSTYVILVKKLATVTLLATEKGYTDILELINEDILNNSK